MNQGLKNQLIEAAAEAMEKSANSQAREVPVYTLRMGAVAAVEAVLAALTLNSIHELDAQPAGAVVTDRDGDPWMKTDNGRWLGEASLLREANSETSLQLEAWAPLHLEPFTGGRL